MPDPTIVFTKGRFAADVIVRLFLSVLLIGGIYASLELVFLSFFIAVLLVALWPPVFRFPQKITVDGTEIIIDFLGRRKSFPLTDLKTYREKKSKWGILALTNERKVKVYLPFHLLGPALERIRFEHPEFTVERASALKKFLPGALGMTLLLGGCAIFALLNHDQQTTLRKRGYDNAAIEDAKNAYTAAMAYFTDYPSGNVWPSVLAAYGYRSNTGVSLDVKNKHQASLLLLTRHASGKKEYMVDDSGNIAWGKIGDKKWNREVQDKIIEQNNKGGL